MPATLISYRPRGFIISNYTHEFYPHGGALQQLHLSNLVNITAFRPDLCPATVPPTQDVSQASCSVLNSLDSPACNYPLEGSPLVGSPLGNIFLVGILINRAGCVPVEGNSFMLQFLDVDDFRLWIDETSDSRKNVLSAALIILSSLISGKIRTLC